MWLEAFYRFGATWAPEILAGATAVYLVWNGLFHWLRRALPRLPELSWLIFAGLVGFAFEWFAVGNSPWGNPDALQSGMFAFHAVYPLWGAILLNRSDRRRITGLWLVAAFTLLGLVGFLLPVGEWRTGWFLFVPLALFPILLVYTLIGPKTGAPPLR
ncbi:MAG: hypothetical protein C0427_07130 [Rhodobacter sp.]|nr:hypothetical protein [Rhodobacter sp.]